MRFRLVSSGTTRQRSAVPILALLIATAALAWSSVATSATLLDERFNYPNGNLVGNTPPLATGPWNVHSGTTLPIQVSGNKVTVVQNATSGAEDDNVPFTPRGVTDKTYASFKVVVTTPTAFTTNDYFAHLNINATTFRSRVHVVPVSGRPNQYALGIQASANAGTVVTHPSVHSFGDVVQVVHSYDAANGACSLWVNPLDQTSFAVTVVGTSGGAISAYALRQAGNATTHNLTEIVDEIGVGATYSEALLSSDLAISGVCVTDSTKACPSGVFVGQPWHIKFHVDNVGQKDVNQWYFSIVLQQPGGPPIPLKDVVAQPPIPAGQGADVNWPSPFIFDTSQKGPWIVTVQAHLNQVNQTDPTPNNIGTTQFIVSNKAALPSDLAVTAVCATLPGPDPKPCVDTVYVNQPWHTMFTVQNVGQKPVDSWVFYIVLTTATGQIVIKDSIPGPPLLVGQSTTLNWNSPYIFGTGEKGPAVVEVSTSIRDPGNPDSNPVNDHLARSFEVRNKQEPEFSDLAIRNVCPSRPDGPGGGIGCTVFFDTTTFRAFNQVDGKFLKGIETFEETDVPPGGKSMCPAPFGPNPSCGFPTGLTQRNLIIQDNITPGPSPTAPNPSGKPNALYVVNTGFIGANSAKVGEDIFLDGRNASIDLIFTEPNHTGIGFKLSRFQGYPNGGWIITTYNKAGAIISQTPVPPPAPNEPDKAFFGIWCNETIGRINIFDEVGPSPEAIDDIEMWEEQPKACTDTVYVNQPWHINFTVANEGNKSIDNWTFDISLIDSTTGAVTPIKSAVQGPPLPTGAVLTINWPSPYTFTSDQKGPWSVFVLGRVHDPGNPDSDPSDNTAQDFFAVRNKEIEPPSDIAVTALCATLDDSLKQCSPVIYTNQPWHTLFTVTNIGQKPVDIWNFSIVLNNGPMNIVLKQNVPGQPLPVGGVATINWPSPFLFTTDQKGTWTVTVTATIKDPTNPDSDPSNNVATATFVVENKRADVTDIGVRDVCAADDSTKVCTDAVETRTDWHILFTVVNKGEKIADIWNYTIDLLHNGQLTTVKPHTPGPPLPVGGSTTINWSAPFQFTTDQDKGEWDIFVTVTVKDSTNPDTSLSNNRAQGHFVVDNPTATLLSLFQAEPVNDGIELRWQFGEPQSIASIDLERADAVAGPWRVISAERRDESGVSVALDRDVQTGRIYYYRIVVRTVANERFTFGPLSGELGVGVTEFALPRVSPNPSFGMTQLEFTVPSEAPLRLTIVDIQGREMAVLADGVHRPGRYQATWTGRTERGRAPVGVYLVVYQVPGKNLVKRLVLAR